VILYIREITNFVGYLSKNPNHQCILLVHNLLWSMKTLSKSISYVFLHSYSRTSIIQVCGGRSFIQIKKEKEREFSILRRQMREERNKKRDKKKRPNGQKYKKKRRKK